MPSRHAGTVEVADDIEILRDVLNDAVIADY